MIPVGTRVMCLYIDYTGSENNSFNVVGTVIENKAIGYHNYTVQFTDGIKRHFRPHQIVEIPIYKTEIYKALTEGD